MTMSSLSDVKMQYLVRMFSRVWRAKKVLVKSTRSGMTLLFASAQKDVNSKLLLVFWPLRLPECSLIAENLVVLE